MMNSRTRTRLANTLLATQTGNGRSRQATVRKVAANASVDMRCHQLCQRCSRAYLLLAINNSLPLRIVAFFSDSHPTVCSCMCQFNLVSNCLEERWHSRWHFMFPGHLSDHRGCYAKSTHWESGKRHTSVKSVSLVPRLSSFPAVCQSLDPASTSVIPEVIASIVTSRLPRSNGVCQTG